MRRNHHLLLAIVGSAALLVAAQDTAKTTAAASKNAQATTDKLTNVSSFVKSSSAASSSSPAAAAASSKGSSQATDAFGHPTGLPTLAGATIPTMIVPNTADAPFMQKSTVPEGTIFIAVGACLAFLGATVLGWRAMVAWTIDRSVKRAALASVMASDSKTKYGPGGNLYAMPQRSSLSLDALTSAAKPMSSSGPDKDRRKSRQVKADPSSLFFSPTAGQARNSAYMPVSQDRNSAYLPAGYYAASGAQAAGGRDSVVMGGAPSMQSTFNRHSRAEHSPSSSRDESRRQRSNSAALLAPANPPLYSQPSTSSLAVGIGARPDDGSNVGSDGSRAPSAYFANVLSQHGNGPRERY
jgi:hypothetical protein